MVSPDVCTESGNSWCFQKPIVAGQAVPPQFNVTEVEPLKVMLTVEPELVNVAVPVAVQLVVSGVVDQGFVTIWVLVVALAVKGMVPETVVIVPPQVSKKL